MCGLWCNICALYYQTRKITVVVLSKSYAIIVLVLRWCGTMSSRVDWNRGMYILDRMLILHVHILLTYMPFLWMPWLLFTKG